MRYAKLINGEVEFAPQNKGSICNYNNNIELMEQDGYKPFKEVEIPETSRSYHIEYKETSKEISEVIVYDETEEEYSNRRTEEFSREFFNTSLGWVSRKVHMQNGEIWNFLKDIKPSLKVGAEIITYTPNEDYTDLTQNTQVIVTQQFLDECDEQIHKDFYGE